MSEKKVTYNQFMKLLREAKVITHKGNFTPEFVGLLTSPDNALISAIKQGIFRFETNSEVDEQETIIMYMMDTLETYSTIFQNMDRKDLIRTAHVLTEVIQNGIIKRE